LVLKRTEEILKYNKSVIILSFWHVYPLIWAVISIPGDMPAETESCWIPANSWIKNTTSAFDCWSFTNNRILPTTMQNVKQLHNCGCITMFMYTIILELFTHFKNRCIIILELFTQLKTRTKKFTFSSHIFKIEE
jgi:hypothetical protein